MGVEFFVYDEVRGDLKVIVRALIPFAYLNFTNGEVSAAGRSMDH
jgi:hypothetical protein